MTQPRHVDSGSSKAEALTGPQRARRSASIAVSVRELSFHDVRGAKALALVCLTCAGWDEDGSCTECNGVLMRAEVFDVTDEEARAIKAESAKLRKQVKALQSQLDKAVSTLTRERCQAHAAVRDAFSDGYAACAHGQLDEPEAWHAFNVSRAS